MRESHQKGHNCLWLLWSATGAGVSGCGADVSLKRFHVLLQSSAIKKTQNITSPLPLDVPTEAHNLPDIPHNLRHLLPGITFTSLFFLAVRIPPIQLVAQVTRISLLSISFL